MSIRFKTCLLSTLVLAAFAAPAALGCSSSDESSPPSQSPDGGTSDASPDDSSTEAAADSSTEDASHDSATSEASTTDASDAQAEAGQRRFALFVASDYVSQAQLAAIDLDSNALLGRLTSTDQDSIVSTDHGRGFFLHRQVGSVTVLNQDNPSQAERDIDINLTQSGDAGAAKANPQAVVVSTPSKAYVIRYGSNKLAVVNPSDGSLASEVDLSAYVTDADGLVDAFAGVFDATSNRLYVGLQRIDQNAMGSGSDFAAPCLASKAAIVAIDTTTDTIVDLNGSAQGELLELNSVDPYVMRWDEAGRRIVVLSIGCADASTDGGTGRLGRGVEAVSVDQGTVSWLWQTQELIRPSELLWISPTDAIVGYDDATFTRHWMRWNPTQTALGAELTGVPSAPAYDGQGALVGIVTSSSEAGTTIDVQRYDLTTGQTSILVSDVFPGAVPYTTSSASIY